MSFSVKRDFLSIFLIEAFMVFIIALTIFCTLTSWGFWIFVGIFIFIFLFYNFTVIFASCEMDDNHLIFKTGFFKYDIDLNTVKRVSKSKNIYKSLALSVDRLKIEVIEKGVGKDYYVSVEDNDKLMEFINLRLEHKGSVSDLKVEKEEVKPMEVQEVEVAGPESAVVSKNKVSKRASSPAKTTATKATKSVSKKPTTTKVASAKSKTNIEPKSEEKVEVEKSSLAKTKATATAKKTSAKSTTKPTASKSASKTKTPVARKTATKKVKSE